MRAISQTINVIYMSLSFLRTCWVPFILAALSMVHCAAAAPVPFTIEGPGVDPAQFRITTFSSGMNYPLGMAELPDGSLLCASTDGPSYFNANARLIRLVDADHDGFADGAPATLFTGLSGGITSVQVAGQLVFVTGQNRPITVLRMEGGPTAPFVFGGRVSITYPAGGWLHPHSALGVRVVSADARECELYFQIGSKVNFGVTTQTASLATTNLGGLGGTLLGDSIYRIRFVDRGTNVIATDLTQIASGVRNPAGFAFHPRTGDLYFEDNGIDGLVDANEPFSADELNVLPLAQLAGGGVESYGFPSTYTAYRSNFVVGTTGIRPLVAFQPVSDPFTGAESEGPNDIAFAPPAFPEPLNNGVFVTFHGKFGSGGASNEENPLVFVDLNTTNYFHFIRPRLPGVGHLDGLLRTTDSLFVSDISTNGSLSSGAGRGAIYQIKALVGPAVKIRRAGGQMELSWPAGILQSAGSLTNSWVDDTNASPSRVSPEDLLRFFRTRIP